MKMRGKKSGSIGDIGLHDVGLPVLWAVGVILHFSNILSQRFQKTLKHVTCLKHMGKMISINLIVFLSRRQLKGGRKLRVNVLGYCETK